MIAGSLFCVVAAVLTFGVLTMHTAGPRLSRSPLLLVAELNELEDKLALADVAVELLHGLTRLGETLWNELLDFFEQIGAARLPFDHAGALLKK